MEEDNQDIFITVWEKFTACSEETRRLLSCKRRNQNGY